ncbi:hypothetical protein [Chakrabartyella piscis]|uniref:hypothetical protein n=1 Tax=Chakrabartyella piscis TaxID=2918914 RepID=UPI002958DB9B|nr:hypothetical protein [Chakrabartyella piscis]
MNSVAMKRLEEYVNSVAMKRVGGIYEIGGNCRVDSRINRNTILHQCTYKIGDLTRKP